MQEQRKLPKTRIAAIFIGLNMFSAALVAAAIVFGLAVPMEGTPLHWHIATGLCAVVLGMFSLVAAMFYLVVTGNAIREAVKKQKLPAELFHRTRDFKAKLFPLCMGTIILLITMTVLGAAVHVEKVSKYVHLAFAIVTLVMYVFTIRSMKRNFHQNTVLVADTIDAVDAVTQNP